MKKYLNKNSLIILSILTFIATGCDEKPKTGKVSERNGVLTIKVDLNEVKEGKLTDYFEPHIDYVILEDNDQTEAQIGEIAKLIGHRDRLFVFDWWVGKCVQIFDRQGNFIRRIRNMGEGPEKYLELADIDIVQDTIYLLAHPRKIMKFDLEGNFISEFNLDFIGRTFHYDSVSSRFFIYGGSRSDFLVRSVDHSGHTVDSYFPSNPNIFNGAMGDPYNFYKEEDGVYFTKSYLDTLYKFNNRAFEPRIIFDYGKLKMDHEKMVKMEKEMDPREFMDYFRTNSGFSFSPFGFSNTRFLMTRLSNSDKGYVSVFDKKNNTFDLINFYLINDIDDSFDFYSPVYRLEGDEVAIAYRGTSLYNKAVEKKQSISAEDWDVYQKGKGKPFIEAAFYGKETENYVLMILKTKK